MPIVNGEICSCASHFFGGPGGGILYNIKNGYVELSPQPTKLMPTDEIYDGECITELSVVLHSASTAPHWNEIDNVFRNGAFGCMDLTVDNINSVKHLQVVLDPKKWSNYHANIRGWHSNKNIQQIQAIKLAKNARLIIRGGHEKRLLLYCAEKSFQSLSINLLAYCAATQTIKQLSPNQ